MRNGLLFVSPWLFGFFAFQLYPIFYSLRLSFTRYSGFGSPVPIGLDNFRRLFADPLFWKTSYNTLYYTAFAVPLGVVVAIALALAMNQKVREVAVYRALLYLPSILPIFAISFVWIMFSNPRYGLLNVFSRSLGLPVIDWTGDPRWTKPSLIILAQLGAGGTALIFLAGIRAIPSSLFESARIDGAGPIRCFLKITLPLITPVILYALILGLSLGLQIFTQAYVIAGSGYTVGPDDSLLFYVLYVYRNAFQFSQMGYASALVWVLFMVSLVLAFLVFRWGKSWVHYEIK